MAVRSENLIRGIRGWKQNRVMILLDGVFGQTFMGIG
jgi:hypothetical protein